MTARLAGRVSVALALAACGGDTPVLDDPMPAFTNPLFVRVSP
jgi:hypothetical protein